MTPENPFLQALLAEPEDDTLRLAMADWLDENDHDSGSAGRADSSLGAGPESRRARAEFIRVQIELARGVPDRARRCQLELRQRDLLIAHDADWVAPLAKVLGLRKGQWGGWVFRRGFVEYFNLPATVINKYGGKLARLTPVRELFLRPCTSGNVVALCQRPWLASVTHLYLEDANLDPPAGRALLDCGYLTNLRVLRYRGLNLSTDDRVRFFERFCPMLQAT